MRKILIAMVAFCSSTLMAQPGTVDVNFGANGKVTTPIGNANDYCGAVLKLSTGKILAAGSTTSTMAFACYNPDGTLDLSFNGTGIMTYDFGAGNDKVNKLVEQPDGKIIAVGDAIDAIGTTNTMAIMRINPDGTFDNAFGSEGKVNIHFNTPASRCNAVLLQPDGKIVLGGMTEGAIIYKMAIARLNSDGSFDTSFSGDGMQTTVIFGRSEYITALALQPDGKIVASGGTILSGGSNQGNFVAVRYLSNGTLDSSFSADGVVNFFVSNSSIALDMLLQPDGKILMGGYAGVSGSGQDFAMARLLSDGTLDAEFGTAGIMTTPVSTANDWIFALQLQPDGKILGIGDALNTGSNYDFAVARYLSDGTLDSSFGTNGIVTTDFNALLDRGFCSAIDGDGLLVGGVATQGTEDFALVRYELGIELGVADQTFLQLDIFPNPATNFITLSSKSVTPIAFTITDAMGKQVLSGVNASEPIDISSLQCGLYFLNGEGYRSVKFIRN